LFIFFGNLFFANCLAVFLSFFISPLFLLTLQLLDSVKIFSKGSCVPERSPQKENNQDVTIQEKAKSYKEMKNATLSFIHLEVSIQLNILIAVLQDGQLLLCTTSSNGVKKGSDIAPERWLGIYDAVCAAIAHEQSILAVGCKSGDVNLFDLADNAVHIRTISLYDWG
jgi:hypothetical protein